MTAATGGPLRGIGKLLQWPGRRTGEGAASCFAALPGRTAAAIAQTQANPGQVFSAGRLRTILVRSAGPVSIVGGVAGLRPANRGGGTLLQRLGRGFAPPSGRRPRGPGPKLWALESRACRYGLPSRSIIQAERRRGGCSGGADLCTKNNSPSPSAFSLRVPQTQRT